MSPAGAALVREARERKTAYLAQALEGLTPQEQATLDAAASIMERLIEAEDAR